MVCGHGGLNLNPKQVEVMDDAMAYGEPRLTCSVPLPRPRQTPGLPYLYCRLCREKELQKEVRKYFPTPGKMR